MFRSFSINILQFAETGFLARKFKLVFNLAVKMLSLNFCAKNKLEFVML